MKQRLRLALPVLRLLVVVAISFGSLAWNRPAEIMAASMPPPILLIVNDSAPNKYGRYLGEILRAEGLNAFDTAPLATLNSATLAQYRLAVLADTALTPAQAILLADYVNGGGRLVAMRPDAQIAGLFGLTPAGSNQANGYLAINPAQPAGQGLPSATLQIHGDTTRYNLSGATTIAQLYSSATTSTAYPAVVTATSGSGRTAAFSYDLASNVILTRQGNPANANVDTDNDGVLRTIDLFQSATPGGSPWVNRDRIAIPQADIQQRLFARLIAQLLDNASPLPKLWYFPDGAKTMLILTADAHANPTSYYQNQINSITAHHGRMTFYVTIAGDPSDASVQAWRAQGYEFGIHPYSNKPDSYPPYNITSLAQGYQVYTTWFGQRFTSPASRTVRNHQVAWLGWTDAADLAVSYGFALDTNFYHWGPWLQKPDGSWPHGYITGSGQPMKFVRSDGTILPYYQQLTQLVDEHLLSAISGGYEGLNGSQAVAVSQQLIDASLNGDYAALMTQFHTDYYGFGSPQQWAEGTLDYAYNHGVPIWNADQWLRFIEARNSARYADITWNAGTNTLSFAMESPAGTQNLTTQIPFNHSGMSLASVTVDGVPASYSIQSINGVNQAFVSTLAGNHSFSAIYQAGGATATPTNTPTATPTAGGATPTNTPTSTLTHTPTNTPTSTLTHTPTNTPTSTPTSTPISNSTLIHTSVADFGQGCATLAGTSVSGANGGSLVLAGAEVDEFSAATLDPARWASGSWSAASYTPGLSGGVLTLPGGGFVRSLATTTHGSLTATATFGNGAWQHIGFGSLGFAGDTYLLFSTIAGDGNLYVRANVGTGEQLLSLGPIPAGAHTYQIDWSAATPTDRVAFLVDGVLRASFTLPVNRHDLHLYLSNNGGATLSLERVQYAPSYVASGSYTSCPLDATAGAAWQTIAWNSSALAGTSLLAEARSSADGSAWGAWATVNNGGTLASPARFAQYRLTLATTNPALSPLVEQVSLSTQSQGATATATATNTPTGVPTSTPTQTPTSTPTNTPTSPSNLLANSGFELDSNNDNRPDSWTTNAGFTRSSASKHSGSFAGRHAGNVLGRNYTVTQSVSSLSVRPYTFSGWVHIPSTTDSFTFQLQIRWQNSAGTILRTDLIRSFTDDTGAWTAVTASLNPPSSTARAQVAMVISGLSSTIYVDDFVLQ